jgi:hypothetical protein
LKPRKYLTIPRLIEKIYGVRVKGILNWPDDLEADGMYKGCTDDCCTGTIYYPIRKFKFYSKTKQVAILKHEVVHAIQHTSLKAQGCTNVILEHDQKFWITLKLLFLDDKIIEMTPQIAHEFISCMKGNCIGHSTGD